MKIKLPTEKKKGGRIDPRSIVIFGNYKIGKTTILSELDNVLILDLESGTDFVDAVKIDILEEAKENDITPFKMLSEVMKKISEENEKLGQKKYKFIAVDTVTALEDISLELAESLYRATPMGRNWSGKDIRELPQGAGYWFLRKALLMITGKLEAICDTLIITGHIKDKLIETAGEEITQRGLALTGKSGAILCAHVDAVAYMYRDDKKGILNFKPSEHLSVGTRSEHLNNKKITLSEMDEHGKINVYWDRVFIDK